VKRSVFSNGVGRNDERFQQFDIKVDDIIALIAFIDPSMDRS
jgi:hypothetical protein